MLRRLAHLRRQRLRQTFALQLVAEPRLPPAAPCPAHAADNQASQRPQHRENHERNRGRFLAENLDGSDKEWQDDARAWQGDKQQPRQTAQERAARQRHLDDSGLSGDVLHSVMVTWAAFDRQLRPRRGASAGGGVQDYRSAGACGGNKPANFLRWQAVHLKRNAQYTSSARQAVVFL